jgi:hypothetical protein
MERWAANTLRTLGIILASGFVLVTSLFLGLMAVCAYGGDFNGHKNPQQGPFFILGAVAVITVGVLVVAKLARGISRASAPAQIAEANGGVASSVPISPGISVPLQFSSAAHKAIDNLVLVLGAQIVLSAAIWLANQRFFWKNPAGLGGHNWTLLLLAPFILYHLPYAILIWALLKRPDRHAFTYSIAVPAMMILQSLFSLSVVTYYYVHQPIGIALLVIPWLLNIVVLVVAYKAIQQIGLHPAPSSLVIAAVVSFLYFSFIHVLTPFIYRFALRT